MSGAGVAIPLFFYGKKIQICYTRLAWNRGGVVEHTSLLKKQGQKPSRVRIPPVPPSLAVAPVQQGAKASFVTKRFPGEFLMASYGGQVRSVFFLLCIMFIFYNVKMVRILGAPVI